MASAAEVPRQPPPDRPEEGGETVCWAHLVCPACGRMASTSHPEVCEECGADFPE